MRFFVASVFSLFVVSVSLSAQVSVSGTWSGEYALTDRCDNGATFTSKGIASATLVQTASQVTGVIVLKDLVLTDGGTCVPREASTLKLPISGTISGGSISGTFTAPGPQSISFTGAVGAGSVTIEFGGEEVTSGTITLTQTSTARPDSQLTGSWTGTYAFTEPSDNGCPALAVSGAAQATFVHAGEDFSGFLIALDTRHYDLNSDGSCRLHEHVDAVFYVTGTVSGNSVTATGTLLEDDDDDGDEGDGPSSFTFLVSGDTISGLVDGVTVFTLHRSTSTASPIISSFDADPDSIEAGEASTLRWSTFNATSVTIDNGIGAQGVSGSVTVSPHVTTTYTLTAVGGGGSTISRTTVTVGGGAARLAVAAAPAGFAQLAGTGGGTDSFTIANIGEGPSSVTLTSAGNFFSISPTSFTLDPGASQTITITGTAQPPGSYEGSVSITGAGAEGELGVRVRMLAAAAPSGTVAPAPAVARVEVASSVGQNASGAVEFTNAGTAVLQGIAVSDAPWIVPESGVVSIPPGQRVAITYMIDSAKRPDAGSAVGAATGKLSLVYIGSGSGGLSAFGAAGSTSSVSVTLVHVARPSVTAGTPSPLGSGELALFTPGLGNRPGAVGDLLLANDQPAALNNIAIFMTGVSAPTQLTSIAQIAANSSVTFPGLIRNVFNDSVPTGTAQIRGADTSRLSVAAILANTSLPVGTFSTALPVFRSDGGAGGGARIILPGLSKSGSVQTNLYVQELSGAAGSFLVEILDGDGNVLMARGPETIEAFGFVELLDIVPASPPGMTRSGRVTNAAGSARLNAYALVANTTNNDSWLVTDPGVDTAASGVMIMPLLLAGPGAQTSMWVTNRSNAAVTATIEERSVGRRRAVVHSTSRAKSISVALEPQKTVAFATNLTSGSIRISAPAGTISAAARSTIDSEGANAHGSGLPVVPASEALHSGQVKRFMGVDDASAQSRARKVPATFATHLALVESDGQSATVRVTVQFALASGSLVSSTPRASREYRLAAGQFRLISNLARDVIGSQRDSFGDLRNMTVDVEVVSGSGGVIPFLQSVDQGSGDMLVRIE